MRKLSTCKRCGASKSSGKGKKLCDLCRRECPNVIYKAMYRACRHFGIKLKDGEQLKNQQNGCCAICGEPEQIDKQGRGLQMDHDHITGHIRGLLCRKCNTMLAMARDKPHILRLAAGYLEQPPAILVAPRFGRAIIT